jgi:multiple sugar transport system permease protein
MSRREKIWWIVAGVLIVGYALAPIAWIVSLSFKAPSDLANGQFLPTDASTENYWLILTGAASDLFLPALRNSFGICLIATAISCVLSMFAAYAIARLDFPGKKFILGTALAVAIFPVISIVTPLFNLWRNIGLYDTWPGLIIPYLSLTLPISIWTMSAFFREIPWEMEQAAQVDGATTWQAFRKVIVPLAAPGVFTTAIIAFFIAWNDFVYGISLTSTSASRPVPAALGLFSGASQFEDPTGAIAAAAVIVTIPVVVLVLLFQRRIVAGLTNGAVKG